MGPPTTTVCGSGRDARGCGRIAWEEPPGEARWAGRVTRSGSGGTLAVPWSQLEGIAVSEHTRQAIEDWHYWAARYEL
ncbi:MAG TPA: calcium-binding protein [Actinomycetes bacterium]|nr:calcium-binding protein [Actinomycetes bacterium]